VDLVQNQVLNLLFLLDLVVSPVQEEVEAVVELEELVVVVLLVFHLLQQIQLLLTNIVDC